jgi:NitT/TauT family transport system substrate-binding protein
MRGRVMLARKTTSVIITFIVLLVVSVCVVWYLTSTNRSKPTATVQKITIAQAGDFFLYAPLYVASDAGLFSKNGLEVRLISTGGDEKTWAAVISGDAQFGVADPTFVAISATRGQPGRVIATDFSVS